MTTKQTFHSQINVKALRISTIGNCTRGEGQLNNIYWKLFLQCHEFRYIQILYHHHRIKNIFVKQREIKHISLMYPGDQYTYMYYTLWNIKTWTKKINGVNSAKSAQYLRCSVHRHTDRRSHPLDLSHTLHWSRYMWLQLTKSESLTIGLPVLVEEG